MGRIYWEIKDETLGLNMKLSEVVSENIEQTNSRTFDEEKPQIYNDEIEYAPSVSDYLIDLFLVTSMEYLERQEESKEELYDNLSMIGESLYSVIELFKEVMRLYDRTETAKNKIPSIQEKNEVKSLLREMLRNHTLMDVEYENIQTIQQKLQEPFKSRLEIIYIHSLLTREFEDSDFRSILNKTDFRLRFNHLKRRLSYMQVELCRVDLVRSLSYNPHYLAYLHYLSYKLIENKDLVLLRKNKPHKKSCFSITQYGREEYICFSGVFDSDDAQIRNIWNDTDKVNKIKTIINKVKKQKRFNKAHIVKTTKFVPFFCRTHGIITLEKLIKCSHSFTNIPERVASCCERKTIGFFCKKGLFSLNKTNLIACKPVKIYVSKRPCDACVPFVLDVLNNPQSNLIYLKEKGKKLKKYKRCDFRLLKVDRDASILNAWVM